MLQRFSIGFVGCMCLLLHLGAYCSCVLLLFANVCLTSRAIIVCVLAECCYAIVSCSLVVVVLNLVMMCILFVFVTDACECVVIESCSECLCVLGILRKCGILFVDCVR